LNLDSIIIHLYRKSTQLYPKLIIMSFRKLKILSKGQRRTYGNYVHVPEIKLEGKWLEKLGFELGGEVMVKQQKGKLTITPKKRESE
jgi:toxic protein SymE